MDHPERRLAAGLLAVSGALTLAMAAPVLRLPSERLFGAEIVGRHADPFTVIGQFENPRALGLYTQPATDYVGAAITAVVGDGVVAYNLLVLASFPLAALFAGLLALRLTGSQAAAWIAGLAYAFAPFHVAHAAYHPHVAQTQWLPLYLLALWLCLERFSVGRAALLAAATALVVLSNFYSGLIAAVLTPVAVLGFWLVQRGREAGGSGSDLARTLLTLGLVAAAGLGWVAAFAPQVIESPDSLAFPEGDLRQYTARWWSYLLPPVGHPLAPGWVEDVWRAAGDGRLEQQLTIGLGLLLLAAVAVIARGRGGGGKLLAAAPALALIGAVAYLMALPPSGGRMPLMPSELLYGLLPMFRAYARFGLVVFLMAAVLAAMGFAFLLGRNSRGARIAAWGLLALAVVELAPFPPSRWRDVLPTAAHRWLAGQPEGVRLFDCVSSRLEAERTAAAFLGHPMGWLRGLEDCGDPGLAGRLATGGYTHVVVRRESAFGSRLATWPPPAGLELDRELADSLLFRVGAAPTEVHITAAAGLSWREYRNSGSFRWMGAGGSLNLVNATSSPQSGSVELELHAFPGPRSLSVRLDGTTVAELEISTRPESYGIGPLALESGRHILELETDEQAVVADEILGNGDPRPLAVAVWDWRWRPEP